MVQTLSDSTSARMKFLQMRFISVQINLILYHTDSVRRNSYSSCLWFGISDNLELDWNCMLCSLFLGCWRTLPLWSGCVSEHSHLRSNPYGSYSAMLITLYTQSLFIVIHFFFDSYPTALLIYPLVCVWDHGHIIFCPSYRIFIIIHNHLRPFSSGIKLILPHTHLDPKLGHICSNSS